MQELIHPCQEYGHSHNISYSLTRTMFMALKSEGIKTCEACLTLNGNKLNFVNKTKYLGIFTENNKTDSVIIQ